MRPPRGCASSRCLRRPSTGSSRRRSRRRGARRRPRSKTRSSRRPRDPAMGAPPLRRAIQRYIEDPLADFVLRAELVPGGTVMVEPAPDGSEEEVKLTIIKPAERPAPVPVGGGKEDDEEAHAGDDEHGAPSRAPLASDRDGVPSSPG